MTVNKVILVGNLGADPELRTTTSGMAIANLRLATQERTKSPEGNWVDTTEWHRVVLFGKVAENAGTYLKKGRQVYIEGKIRTRKWTDRDGTEKYTTEVVGDVMRFLQGGAQDGPSAPPEQQRSPPKKRPLPEEALPPADDDLPF